MTLRVDASLNFKSPSSSGIINGSSFASCLVGSEMILYKRRFRKLYMFGFNKSSFRSPKIILYFLYFHIVFFNIKIKLIKKNTDLLSSDYNILIDNRLHVLS